jgi:hypothetical protein
MQRRHYSTCGCAPIGDRQKVKDVNDKGDLSLFCINQWEEEKYFILFRYWLKSKSTSPHAYVYATQDKTADAGMPMPELFF